MMRNPPHPGEHIAEDYLKPLSITVTAAAAALGVARKTLSQIINGKSGISADMAIRLSRVFGASPGFWLRWQDNYDIWHASKHMKNWKPKVTFIDHIHA